MAATCITIGDAMKAYRGMNGLAQRQLGELLGVKQTDISLMENGCREISPEAAAALEALIGASAGQEQVSDAPRRSAEVLLREVTAARQELGYPLTQEEAAALASLDEGELLSQSILLREAMEVQASRELLAGAKAFRRKREAARGGEKRVIC